MRPILFKEDSSNYSTNGIGVLYDSISCNVLEEHNGIFEVELEYPADGEWVGEILEGCQILAKPNDVDEPHSFRIFEVEKDLEYGVVYARAMSVTNDLGGNLIPYASIEDATAQEALNKIKNSLIEPTPFDLVSDIQTRSSSEWTRINPLQAIAGVRGSLVDLWGGEIKRTNNAIHLYSRRGRDRVTTIRPGKNIEGFNMIVSIKGVVTKLFPYLNYSPVTMPEYEMVEDFDGTMVKQEKYSDDPPTQQEPVMITGDIVVSDNVDKYPVVHYTAIDYSDDQELMGRIQKFVDDRFDEAYESPTPIDNSNFPAELKQYATDLLNAEAERYFIYTNPGIDKPKVTIKADMLQLSDSPDWEIYKDLESIQITDTVDVYVKKFDVDVELKIDSIDYDSIGESIRGITAGSSRSSFAQGVSKEYDDKTQQLEDYITNMENGIRNDISRTADGLSRRFSGYTEPPHDISSDGDLWFKEVGSGKVEIYIYDGGIWQPVMSKAVIDEINQDLDEARQIAEDADGKVQAVIDDISGVISDNGFTNLGDLIASKITEDDFSTLYFQESKAIGFVYEIGGETKAIIMINDGVPYIKGEHIILNGDTIVDGSFTVTDEMIANDAVIKHLVATGIDANDVRIVNLDVDSIVGGDLELTKGFRITHNGQPVISVDANTGKVTIAAPNLATKDDLDGIELTPGPKGDKGDTGDRGLQGIQGPEGDQGIRGPKGDDGIPSYTHLAYATGTTGQNFSTSHFNLATYIGMYVDSTEMDSNDYKKYKWSLIKGADGGQGIPGQKGTDGKTPYLHIAYATNGTGTSGFSTTVSAGKTYIGQYTDFVQADSNDPSKYSWTLIKGDKGDKGDSGPRGLQGIQGPEGDKGIQGPKGIDGKTSYTHIAYADNSSGSGFSQNPTNKTYIGMYVDFNATDSTDPTKYKWSLIKGADGAKGIAGPKGDDGRTPYFHTAWANNATGTSGFSTTDSVNKLYIGTYTDFVQADSTDSSKYSWSKIKGDKGDKGDTGSQGAQGIQGPKGANGTSQYVHIGYSANANGNPMTNSPQSNSKYIGLANTTSSTAPPGYASYNWALIKGADGAMGQQGIQGAPGTNGQTTYTWVKYADNANGGGMSDNPDGKLYIGLAFNKTTQTESNTASQYAWSLMPQNIEIGGRNLALDSGVGRVTSAYMVAEYFLSEDFIAGETYSATLKGTKPTTQNFGLWQNSGSSSRGNLVDMGNDIWSITFTSTAITAGNERIVRIYQPSSTTAGPCEIEWFQLEHGNVRSSYSPAPEDIQSNIDSDLDSLSEIVSGVASELFDKAGMGELEAIEEAFNSRVEQDIQDKEQLMADLATLEGRTELIEILAGDNKLITEFIETVITESEEGIFIGNRAASMGVLVAPDRISFIDNGTEVAYISNQTMEITHGIFVESATISGFHFEKMPGTEILAITWVGD